jgi:hypothetical protein
MDRQNTGNFPGKTRGCRKCDARNLKGAVVFDANAVQLNRLRRKRGRNSRNRVLSVTYVEAIFRQIFWKLPRSDLGNGRGLTSGKDVLKAGERCVDANDRRTGDAAPMAMARSERRWSSGPSARAAFALPHEPSSRSPATAPWRSDIRGNPGQMCGMSGVIRRASDLLCERGDEGSRRRPAGRRHSQGRVSS